MKQRFLFFLLVLALCVATPAVAQDAHNDPNAHGTTGLFVVPRASTLQPGAFSIGAYYRTLAREEGGTNVEDGGIVGAFAFGATERLEIFASFQPRVGIRRDFILEEKLGVPKPLAPRLNDHPFAATDWTDSVGDLRAGLKYKVAGDPLSYDGLAVSGHVKFPTADDEEGIGTGKFDFGGNVIGSYEAGEMIGINGTVGVLFRQDPDEFDLSNELHYGAGLHVGTRFPVQGIFELFGVSYFDDADTDILQGVPAAPFLGLVDYTVVQGGLRVSLDNGLAFGGGLNYNITLDEPSILGGMDLEKLGSFVHVSWTKRPYPVVFRGTAPRALPPVNRPPTLECRAEQTTVRQGESVRLFADVNDPDGDAVTVTWTASAGTISPETGTEVTWSTEGVAAGSGPISATASDGFGGTAACELRMTVEAPPAPPEPITQNFVCSEFDSGSTRIDNRCKAVLDDIALQLRDNPRATAVVTGHSDNVGSADRNRELAQERADNARQYLVETHGLDSGRITTESAGGDQPVADNSTRAGRAQNRRIEIVVTIPGE